MSADLWTESDHAQLLEHQLLERAADQLIAGDSAGANASLFWLELPRDTYGQIDLLIAFAAIVRARERAADERNRLDQYLQAHLSD